jgi:hypothetical protein
MYPTAATNLSCLQDPDYHKEEKKGYFTKIIVHTNINYWIYIKTNKSELKKTQTSLQYHMEFTSLNSPLTFTLPLAVFVSAELKTALTSK